MTATKKLYKCSCGYATHFEKALEAHCRFRHHEPLADEPKQAAPVKAAPKKADEPKPAKAATVKKTTRKPRTKKAVKE